MNIIVRTSLEIDPVNHLMVLNGIDFYTDTIESLKIKIYERKGIPVDEQKLISLGGTKLENSKYLHDYGLSKGSHINLVLGIDVTLTTRYRRTLTVDMKVGSKIKDVKSEIYKQYGVKPAFQILCNGKNEMDQVQILDDNQSLRKFSPKSFNLIIVENIKNALKEKNKLLDEPYKFKNVAGQPVSVSEQTQSDNDTEEKKMEAVITSYDEELTAALATKYPIFLTDQRGSIRCVLVHLHKDLTSTLANSLINPYKHSIITGSGLNGPTLKWDKSWLEQNVEPETFLNLAENKAMLLSLRCAYFADKLPLMIPVTNIWKIKQIKEKFISECKLDIFDNIKEDDCQLSMDKLHIFRVHSRRKGAENNIIDRTVGYGLEAYKNESRLLAEEINDDDVLYLVPVFNFKISFVYKEKLYKHEIETSSMETCDIIYQQICDILELDPKRILVFNEYGMLNYAQFVESANLFIDNILYVVDSVREVDHGAVDPERIN